MNKKTLEVLPNVLDSNKDLIVLKTPFDGCNRTLQLAGSCNGLLCLPHSDYDGPSYVCNPVLESTLLFPSISEITQYRASIGFGYDSLNDEY